MPNEDLLADDIEFIFEECQRIAKMGRHALKTLPKNDVFFDLPHPSGKGKMLCGRAAAQRIKNLTDEIARRNGLSRRASHQTLRKPTEELLVQRFLKEGRELDRKQIDRFISAVGRKAEAACSDITHFIPCTLMAVQEPETLAIGPVVFHNRASFRRKMLSHMKEYRRDLVQDSQSNYARGLMLDATKFYRQFGWVAEVTVKGCDSETSAVIAGRAAISALDCLHLVFRSKYTDRMSIGGPAIGTDKRGGVTIGEDGKMHPHGSTTWAGQANFAAGWSDQLEDPNLAHILSLCGLALQTVVDPALERSVSQRFLDAAQWFGEASRDDRPASRVVKYVTAIERMVMTDEMGDIQKLVSERVAALCCDPQASDRHKWRVDALKVYDRRSRLVHGSVSPTDPEIQHDAWLAARIGEETILSALVKLGEPALKKGKVSTKRLAKWYGAIIAFVDKIEAASTE